MDQVTAKDRARLIDALRQSDDAVRERRADRIIWLSQHHFSPGAVMGRMEPLTLKQEAADSFVNGHFVASLLLAMAFIEHTVMDELIDANLASSSINFVDALALAKKHSLIDADLLDKADSLRLKRNPHTHRKPPGHEHSLSTRYRKQKVHWNAILEADAKEGLELMFAFFRATLRAA